VPCIDDELENLTNILRGYKRDKLHVRKGKTIVSLKYSKRKRIKKKKKRKEKKT
jgi:hypothetical protein